MIRSLFSVFVVGASVLAATAQFEGSVGGGEASVASLVTEAKAIVPGKSVTVALQLQHPEGWHSYFLNSGGIENSPAIEWQLPPGLTAGPIQWPVPEIKDGYGGKSFIYPGTVVLLVELTAAADVKVGGTLAVTAKAGWQICSESCMNEDKEFKLSLAVAAGSEPDPAQAALFKAARAKLPQPESPWTVTAHSPSQTAEVVLRLTPKAGAAAPAAPVEFIPAVKFLQPVSAGGKVARDGQDWVITLQRATKDMMEEPIPQGASLAGILTGGQPGSPDRYAFLIPDTRIGGATATGAGAGAKGSASAGSADAGGAGPAKAVGFAQYLLVLGAMLLGGLILNLMPCVFPVIGLKIMSFVQQAGADRKKIIEHGLLFTVGVLVSFGVLSGIMFAAREALGFNWGFQLEIPGVVLALMLLMFVLALNLSGLFEIGTSATSVGGGLQTKTGLLGSFFSGVLATVVSTPCSGPVLGWGIGVSAGLPALQFFIAFGVMGLGLSLPYLVLSIFPSLVQRLPRPGAWMESFKQGMAFLLFGTAGYLFWVYANQIEADHLLGPLFGLVMIALAGWVYGRWCLPHRKPGVRRTAVVLAVVFAASGVALSLPPKAAATPAEVTAALDWEPWTQAREDALLKEGRPVYIDFTAKWCLTCQVNKKLAYTAEVVALMKQKNIVALKADKTRPDPAINARIRQLGRSAVPVNVLLVPGQQPVITTEALTPGYLIDLFNRELPAK